MRTPVWQRVVARIVLVTFTTGIVACGDAAHDAASSSTTVPEAQPAATVPPPPETVPPPPPTNPPPPSTLPSQAPEQMSKQELRDLVAPVALYPDVVLASLLPATTYPDQVHDAALYVGDAEQVDRVPDDQGWDGSVIGLLQFPDVVRWLDENPAWTDQMGQAVTYQQGDVLDAIQEYRKSVKNVGNLQSNQYMKVRTGKNDDIYIEPAQPDVVYVPSYDPVVATQPQPPPAQSTGINPWIAFGGGALVGALGAWALYSIFDDDDHDHYYYGGRRIRGYDNYYYYRGRRPRTVVWAPRQRQWRRVNGWREPRRLRYAAPAGRPARRAALRPPTKRVGAPAPFAAETKRDRRQMQQQERRERQQQKRLDQQVQRQEKQQRQQQQRDQRQQRNQAQKQQRQERRQEKQVQKQEHQVERRERRQQQQIQQRERRQQQQIQQRDRRQQQQMQRQERRQDQQQQRQERRQEKQVQRQERQQQNQGGGGGGGGGKGNKKNKKGNK